ncbi:MAG: putative metal-binding motif-containing protein [Myxococcales bacterium]|nr:putative metal-binding motif-containing protein [Myxococcales bacterium]
MVTIPLVPWLAGCLSGSAISPTATDPTIEPVICTLHPDADGDGFGDATQTTCDASGVVDGSDCDDTDADVYPGAPEICGEGPPRDDDCDPESFDPAVSIGTDRFDDLASAVGSSEPGDVLWLCSGKHRVENVDLNHSLTVRSASGDPEDVILIGDEGPLFTLYLSAKSLTLVGLTLTQGDGLFGGAVSANIAGGAAPPTSVNLFGTVELDNVVADGNRAYMGGVVAADTVVVRNSDVRGNTATGSPPISSAWGGALFANHVVVEDSTFEGNSADEGGAVFSRMTASSSRSTYRKNTGTTLGGALSAYGTLASDDDTFDHNHVGFGSGGAVHVLGTATVIDGELVANEASFGGGLFAHNPDGDRLVDLILSDTRFTENVGGIEGGGLLAKGYSTVDASKAVFADNLAGGGATRIGLGGGVAVHVLEELNTNWVGGTFQGNDADWAGGGMAMIGCVSRDAIHSLLNPSFLANDATRGAGLFVDRDCQVIVDSALVEGNTASMEGGGVFSQVGSRLSLEQSELRLNEALLGAAAFGLGTHLELHSSAVTSNVATSKEEATAALHISDFDGVDASAIVVNTDLGHASSDNTPGDFLYGAIHWNAGADATFECRDQDCS